MKSLDKKKDKELDWEMTFGNMVLDYYMDCAGSGFEKANPKYEKMVYFIDNLLTQQRTELLEEIKKMELKHSINPNSPSRERKIIYNQAIMDVINLIDNKTDLGGDVPSGELKEEIIDLLSK